ncbi:MAG TPA: DUF2163 domain-containing protein [Stellaceae bacterium]|nr:DUF2163 domain-containing protein [Stellaceae bacterium]
MKPASDALRTLLAGNQFVVADLYTFTLVEGAVLRWTSFDVDVAANGNTFSSGARGGPFFDRKDNKAKAHWKLGVEVDTLSFDVVPGGATVNGLPFLEACRLGAFDGAELQLERAFLPPLAPGTPLPLQASAGTVILFVGRVAEVDLGRSLATFSINSHLELLNLQLPRNLFQSGCVNALYDDACGVSRAPYQVSASVTSWQPDAGVIATGYHGAPNDWFDQGSITFTSGPNQGFARTVKASGTDGASFTNITTTQPFPFAPNVGDAFLLLPGCDKSLGPGGCPKFNNVARFKGFPFVPVPETAV